MATPYHINVAARDTGLFRIDQVEQDEASAAKVTELLQKDLEQHHVFFNQAGFHNHIAHQLLTLYGTGPDVLQAAFDKNKTYQVEALSPHHDVVRELQEDWAGISPKYLGLGQHCPDFLAYFQLEMDKHDWQAVLESHLVGEAADGTGMLGRLYAGLLHPMIQLLYGIEWQQPAIVAQGLAQAAAVHNRRMGDLLVEVEDAAAATPAPTQQRPLPEICETLRRENPGLAASARWEDVPGAVVRGLLARAGADVVALLARIRVGPGEVEERTAEMMHSAAYVAAAASCNPSYQPKFDFFLMHERPLPPALRPWLTLSLGSHLLTSAPFFLAINRLDCFPVAARARMLESKMRLDVLQYIACGCPSLRLDALRTSTPPDPHAVSQPRLLLPRFHARVDDGHAIKTARALLLAQDVSRQCPHRPWLRIQDDMWLDVMCLLLRSIEGPEYEWVRSAGFQEAWSDVPRAD